ncbi:MAG: hypothetical protein ACRDQG_17520 [Pseudonocardiaceae bacterium]
MGALLGDAAVVQDDDLVGVADIGQPVDDQHCGPMSRGTVARCGAGAPQRLKGLEHRVLGTGVHRGGGLVGDEHGGIPVQTTRSWVNTFAVTSNPNAVAHPETSWTTAASKVK